MYIYIVCHISLQNMCNSACCRGVILWHFHMWTWYLQQQVNRWCTVFSWVIILPYTAFVKVVLTYFFLLSSRANSRTSQKLFVFFSVCAYLFNQDVTNHNC